LHDDVAALRRYLVDDGFVDRDAGEYWRTGDRHAVTTQDLWRLLRTICASSDTDLGSR
jgi:hypothetical protein